MIFEDFFDETPVEINTDFSDDFDDEKTSEECRYQLRFCCYKSEAKAFDICKILIGKLFEMSDITSDYFIEDSEIAVDKNYKVLDIYYDLKNVNARLFYNFFRNLTNVIYKFSKKIKLIIVEDSQTSFDFVYKTPISIFTSGFADEKVKDFFIGTFFYYHGLMDEYISLNKIMPAWKTRSFLGQTLEYNGGYGEITTLFFPFYEFPYRKLNNGDSFYAVTPVIKCSIGLFNHKKIEEGDDDLSDAPVVEVFGKGKFYYKEKLTSITDEHAYRIIGLSVQYTPIDKRNE